VRHPFWLPDGSATVPDLLIYADLLGTGDPRDREAARTLYDRLTTPNSPA